RRLTVPDEARGGPGHSDRRRRPVGHRPDQRHGLLDVRGNADPIADLEAGRLLVVMKITSGRPTSVIRRKRIADLLAAYGVATVAPSSQWKTEAWRDAISRLFGYEPASSRA